MELYIYYLYNNKITFEHNLDNIRLELKARDRMQRQLTVGNDSESENDDYIKTTLITTHQQGLNNEHDQSNQSVYETDCSIDEDIFTKEQKLKEEAKAAFALSAKMARMQVEIERQALEKKRPSSLYDIIGINTNDDKPLTIENLEEMNMGQLQVIVNNLYCQIDANNDELVNLLIERDSLSMEQDSILVDIEDLTKRLKERTMNSSKKMSSNEARQRVYIVKYPEQNASKKSIFQSLLRKAMFI